MVTYIIYKATNKANNKSYIGITIQSLERRAYLHVWQSKRKPTSHFHRALAKYGKDSFEWSVLESCELPKARASEREQHFIALYETYENGYNGTKGGEDFSSSDYQRTLQLDRVKNGSHPFIGGEIQKASSKRRWDQGTSSLIGMNQKRISDGTHNFLTEHHPQRRRIARGDKHHNQRNPWENTKATDVWSKAGVLYDWYVENSHKKRGGSIYQMSKVFDIPSSQMQMMYYDYFKKGWNPRADEQWVQTFT